MKYIFLAPATIMFTLLVVLSTTTRVSSNTAGSNKKLGSNRISIMAYNVENLFDTKLDPKTSDFTYIPASKKFTQAHVENCIKSTRTHGYLAICLTLDWSEKVLNEKMERLARSVLQVGGGLGPDVLVVPEVENRGVVEVWNKKYLKRAGYTSIAHIDGPDKRGIDVAILSRLPLIKKPHLHYIPFKGKDENDAKWMKRSRGILEAQFHLPDGTPMTVFGVHFPSPRNPIYWRQQAFKHLKLLASKVPKNHVLVAAGDFNIVEKESSTHMTKSVLKKWDVSHFLGCGNCPGTYFYKPQNTWSFLDIIISRKNDHSKWSMDPFSIYTPNHFHQQNDEEGLPARFNYRLNYGVTDHWPIYVEIKKEF